MLTGGEDFGAAGALETAFVPRFAEGHYLFGKVDFFFTANAFWGCADDRVHLFLYTPLPLYKIKLNINRLFIHLQKFQPSRQYQQTKNPN